MTTYDTPDAILRLAETDPEFEELRKAGAKPAGMVGTFEETAQFWRGLPRTETPPTDTDAPLDIPLRGGRVSKARVYTAPAPSTHTGPRPLIVYIYGGGWALGEPAHIALTAKSLAAATRAVVVAPTYRLSHEAPFPAAPDDVWDALAWLAQPANAATLGADPAAGFILGGVSAGGNLAAVTAQRYVTQGVPGGGAPLTGVALLVPYLLEAPLVPRAQRALWLSRAQNAGAPIIDARAMAFLLAEYKPDVGSPQFSPFNAPNAHEGLPPVFIQVAGLDPLRDDGLVYERVLRERGVKTRLKVYPGVPHIHNFAFPTLKSAYRANLDLIQGVGWLLGREIGDEDAGKAFAIAQALVPAL